MRLILQIFNKFEFRIGSTNRTMLNPVFAPAYSLHNKLAILELPYWAYWDAEEEEWKIQGNKSKLLPYLLIAFGLVTAVGVFATILVLLTFFKYPLLLSREQLMVLVLTTQVIQLSWGQDMLMMKFGNDLIAAMKGMVWIEKRLALNRRGQRGPTPILNWSGCREIPRKSEKQINPFMVGVHQFVSGLTMASIFCPALLSMGNLDPVYLIVIGVGSPHLLDSTYVRLMASRPWFKIIRFTTVFSSMNAILQGVRVIGMIFVTTNVTICLALMKLSKMQSSHEAIKTYRQLQVSLRRMQVVNRFFLGGFLTTSVVSIVIGVNMILLGLNFFGPIIVCTAVFAVVLITTCVLFWFDIGSMVFVSSRSLVRRWEIDGALRRDGGYLKRKARSCRRLAFNVGDVGILDKDTKMNYFDVILGYIVNALISLKG